jgi:hypothetical protein
MKTLKELIDDARAEQIARANNRTKQQTIFKILNDYNQPSLFEKSDKHGRETNNTKTHD